RSRSSRWPNRAARPATTTPVTPPTRPSTRRCVSTAGKDPDNSESPNNRIRPDVTMSTSPLGDRGPQGPRKVRTPQGRMPDNSRAGRPDGKCNREQTADGPTHDGHRQG